MHEGITLFNVTDGLEMLGLYSAFVFMEEEAEF